MLPSRNLLLTAFAALLAAVPVSAQSVRAVATDAATGAPVAEVMVRVEDGAGTVRASGFTDAAGVVVLRLRGDGPHCVRAERAGYRPAARAGIVAGAGGQAAVALRMEQRPFTVDTVTVIARGEDERGRDGFERRRLMGEGVFLDSAYLEPRIQAVPFVGDLLRGVPGVTVGRTPGRYTTAVPRSQRGWKCMVMLIDGRPLPLRFADGGGRELHHVIGPRDIKAVEVYREWSEVPPEFQRYASNGMYRCGAYLYWTRARW